MNKSKTAKDQIVLASRQLIDAKRKHPKNHPAVNMLILQIKELNNSLHYSTRKGVTQ